MLNKLKKYLWLSQISLFLSLIICCLIIPSVVIRNGGVSNFGNSRKTIVLYILGFSLCMFFYCLAANLLYESKKVKKSAKMFWILAGLNLLVLISTFPRHISYRFSEIHDYLGIAL